MSKISISSRFGDYSHQRLQPSAPADAIGVTIEIKTVVCHFLPPSISKGVFTLKSTVFYALRLRWKIDSRAGGKLFTEEDDLLFYLIFRLWLVESIFNIIFSKHGLLTFSEFLMGAYSRLI